MKLQPITAPTVEPVSLAEAKFHMRIDHTTEDVYIQGLISAARQELENITRRAFISQTWDLYLDAFPAGDVMELPLPPLISVTSIKYYDTAGVESTFASASYQLDTASAPARIALADGYSWPSTSLRTINGVAIRFVAGYGSLGSDVPPTLRQAVLLLTAHLYENREATSNNIYLLPLGIDALTWPYRVIKF